MRFQSLGLWAKERSGSPSNVVVTGYAASEPTMFGMKKAEHDLYAWALAHALVRRPGLLLADEPFDALTRIRTHELLLRQSLPG